LRDKILFFALIAFIVSLTFVQDVKILLSLGVMFVILSYKIAIKSIKAILLFNVSVSLGYIIQSFVLNEEFYSFLALFNLRVFDITFSTLYIASRINLINAISFSKSLRFLLSATLSQIESFKKSYEDFMLALKSRSVKKLKERKAKEFISSMFYFFLKKSLHNSKERSLALKARGFFD
jgi:cobalt/nickel transport system permease protein